MNIERDIDFHVGDFVANDQNITKSPGISPQTTCLHFPTQGTSRPSIIDIKSSPRHHQSQTICSNGPTIHLLCFQLIITMNIKDVHHITITDLNSHFEETETTSQGNPVHSQFSQISSMAYNFLLRCHQGDEGSQSLEDHIGS